MLGNLDNLKQMQQDVESAVENGTNTAEMYHKQFADTALNTVVQFLPLGEAGQQIKDFQDQMISGFYDGVRTVNQKGGELTRSVLDQLDNLNQSGTSGQA